MAPQRNAGAGAEAELPEYAGHYRLESCLGSGGMGVVHLARSTSGMKLAVKVVHAEFARDPEFRGRFRQEVGAARRVSGAFTAPVVDADPEAERPWMATLFIPGPTLAEQVKRNGPMAPGQLRRLMAGLAEALRDIHRVGVVHRDLKPSNVLLAEDGPKVIDFGISRPKDSELRTETGKLIGTPPFMAPEQFRRPREVGPAADIFALGSVMVHAATGRGPFDSDSPYVVAYQVVHDEPELTGVPEELAPLVLRCLAKEPQERPSPDELMRELRSVAASYDTQAFIPAQRKTDPTALEPEPEPGAGPEPGAEPEPGAGTGQGPGTDPGPGAGQGPGRRPVPGRGRTSEPEPVPGPERGPESGPEPEARSRPGSPVEGSERRVRRRRTGRRVALAAGVVGLAVAGVLASVQRSGGAGPAPESSPRTKAAGFSAWETAPGSKESTPQCAYGRDKVLCAQSGLVFALDPADGRLVWRQSVARTHVSGPPVLSGGLVQPSLEQGRRREALDPASGEVRWRRSMPAYNGLVSAGDMLLLTGTDGTVTGVDSASGETRWSRRVPGHAVPYFSSFGGDPLAYAASTSADGTSTRLTAVDPRTGDVRWDARLEGALKPLGTADGSVFLTAVDAVYGDTKAVVRYTPGSRAVRRVALPVPVQQAHGTVRGNIVHLVGSGGSVVAVDMGAGRQLWRLETSVTRGSTPVTDGRHVYFTAPDGRLLAVDARAGQLVGQTSPRLGRNADRVAAALPEPVIVGDRVYASAPDGTVFAVDGREPSDW